jgi:hypothetical protein
MKKPLFILFAGVVIIYFSSCKKSNESGNTSSTFTATVNGKATTFKISQATLLRSQPDNEKRLDIVGTSTDNSKQLIITLGMETYQGTGMTVKSYVFNPFPEDDPNTPEDESATTQGFTTWRTALGNGGWLTDVYNEQGLFTVTACDSAHTTISGNFQTTLKDYNMDTTVVSIQDGKLSNVKYSLVN